MADSKTGTGSIQDDPGISCNASKKVLKEKEANKSHWWRYA
jgi:hypothetical protein